MITKNQNMLKDNRFTRSSLYMQCTQTVTIYHKDGDTITRRTIEGVYFGRHKTQTRDSKGDREQSGTLLIIPGEDPIQPGDKVLEGDGPRIGTAEEWAKAIPSTTPGLVMIRSVHPVKYQNRTVHIEAEG